jgi:uncharacterized membrane protein YraQ (UPF0718 family)
MNFDAIHIAATIISAIVSGTIVKLWFSGNGRHKLDTCMELQTQILNRHSIQIDEIEDKTKGAHSIVKNTHERVGRMESIQMCHGEEHSQHSKELTEVRQTCNDLPEKIRNLLR